VQLSPQKIARTVYGHERVPELVGIFCIGSISLLCLVTLISSLKKKLVGQEEGKDRSTSQYRSFDKKENKAPLDFCIFFFFWTTLLC
jgi:hypothetical protein